MVPSRGRGHQIYEHISMEKGFTSSTAQVPRDLGVIHERMLVTPDPIVRALYESRSYTRHINSVDERTGSGTCLRHSKFADYGHHA